jgi:hypothetical protein
MPSSGTGPERLDIAIIGLSALLPGAAGPDEFWRNVVTGRDLMRDVPPTHWNPDDHHDPDPAVQDKTYARRGAFLDPVEFDPLAFGIPPNQIEATDTTQLLSLLLVRRLLDDIADGDPARLSGDRTGVVIGTSVLPLLAQMGTRLGRPAWLRGMREAGIDAREKFVDGGVFWNELFKGDFDMIMNTPASPPSPSKPWSRFEAIMTTRDFAPEGDKVYKNMGRFNDPKAPGYIARIDQLLAKIPTITDSAERAAAYRELNVIFMQQQPTIPLMYRPDQFYEFSTRHWTGFATGQNPYLPPQIPGERLGTGMLWSLKPVPQD